MPTSKSPRELFSLAKRHGAWDPELIPMAEDRPHWASLDPDDRKQLMKVCAVFHEGEVSVSETLSWFLLSVPDPDRRMFLASQAYEEVKHAEFFELYFQEACGEVDPAAYTTPHHARVLWDELKRRGEQLGRALCNPNQDELGIAQVLFATQYFGITEGVLAVTGCDVLEDLAAKTKMFPRLLEGIRLIRADEGRHITHGMDFIREMIRQNDEYVAPVRELFAREIAKIRSLSGSCFHPNGLSFDPQHLAALAHEHYQQRLREAGIEPETIDTVTMAEMFLPLNRDFDKNPAW